MGLMGGLYFLFARELHITPVLLGIVISVGGVSNLIGALFAERLLHRFGLGHTLIGAAWMIGLAMLLVPLARGPVLLCTVFLIAAQLGDMAWPIYSIHATSLRQAITPDHLLGRVSSANHLLFWSALPLGVARRRRHRTNHRNPPDHADRHARLRPLLPVAHPLPHPSPPQTPAVA